MQDESDKSVIMIIGNTTGQVAVDEAEKIFDELGEEENQGIIEGLENNS